MPTAAPRKKIKSSPKRRALVAQIRFQLDQLSATNAQHEFEHICRHFAREAITLNLLPATGPVSAGGDGGRDFETFTTFIRRQEVHSSIFRGVGESKPLVFACSITDRSRLKGKIRDYDAGEWMSLSELMPLVLTAHYEYLDDPDDWGEHEKLQATVFHFIVARATAKALHGDAVVEALNAPLAGIEMPDDLRQELLTPVQGQERYEKATPEEIREKFQEEFHGMPLSDTGSDREYRWSALGIEWRITCVNERQTLAQVEQLVATLQIALADLAPYDLCLLPTRVTLKAKIGTVRRAKLERVPGNDASHMALTLPEATASGSAEMDLVQKDVCAIVMKILSICSCLPDKAYVGILDQAFRDGLESKLFIARPYSDLFLEFSDPDGFDARRKAWLGPENAESWSFPATSDRGALSGVSLCLSRPRRGGNANERGRDVDHPSPQHHPSRRLPEGHAAAARGQHQLRPDRSAVHRALRLPRRAPGSQR